MVFTADRFVFGGHSYKLVRSLETWDDARTAALNAGGYLASITSQAELDFANAVFATGSHSGSCSFSCARDAWFLPASCWASAALVSVPGCGALMCVVFSGCSASTDSESVYIGGSDEGHEGTWQWRDGPDAGVTFWNNGAVSGKVCANPNAAVPW